MKKNRPLLQWILMAVTDILLVSISVPLSFYVALLYDRGEPGAFLPCMGALVGINATSLGFSWLVSWLIYTRGYKDN